MCPRLPETFHKLQTLHHEGMLQTFKHLARRSGKNISISDSVPAWFLETYLWRATVLPFRLDSLMRSDCAVGEQDGTECQCSGRL
jgi:hypothetical protein